MAFFKVNGEGQISFFGEEHGELRDAGQTKVINFSIAVQQRKKEGDKWVNGETLWKKCTAFGRTAENIQKTFKKGDLVLFTGEERADSYEKEGEKVTTSSIIIDSIGPSLRWDTAESHREASKGGGSNNSGGSSNNSSSSKSKSNSGSSSSKNEGVANVDDLDFDDDPF